MYKVYLYFTR